MSGFLSVSAFNFSELEEKYREAKCQVNKFCLAFNDRKHCHSVVYVIVKSAAIHAFEF